MNDSEKLLATQVFIAALRRLEPSQQNPLPFEPRVFAEVVAALQDQGNDFARRFRVFDTIDGKSCPDFKGGMMLAQSAGLISRENPTFSWFSVRMPPRIAKKTLSGTADGAAAEVLAQQYCDRVGL